MFRVNGCTEHPMNFAASSQRANQRRQPSTRMPKQCAVKYCGATLCWPRGRAASEKVPPAGMPRSADRHARPKQDTNPDQRGIHHVRFGIGDRVKDSPSPQHDSAVLTGVKGPLAPSAATPPLTPSARGDPLRLSMAGHNRRHREDGIRTSTVARRSVGDSEATERENEWNS